jgi:phage gpG-like protein
VASSIKVDIDGSIGSAKLKAFDSAVGDMRPVFDIVGNKLLNRIRLCFKLGVDPWGSPWQAIKWRAPSVKQATGKFGGTWDKRKKDGSLDYTDKGRKQMQSNASGKPGQPLRDTGRLQRSISALADGNGVTIGTNLVQARLQQFGGTIVPKRAKVLAFPGPDGELIFTKKVTIKARPYLPLRRGTPPAVDLPPSWSLLITQAIKEHIKSAVEAVV